VWGINGLDRDGFNMWVPGENRGTALFDPAFDLTTSATQEYILGVCNTVALEGCAASGCSVPQLAKPGTVKCILKDFHTWFQGVRNASVAVASNSSVTASDQAMATLYASLAAVPTGDAYPTGSAMLPWVRAFREAVPQSAPSFGVVGGRLAFMVLPFTTTLLKNQPAGVRETVYDVLVAFTDKLNAAAPTGVNNVFADGGRQFTWMRTEQGLLTGMFTGLQICFPVAFLVLLSATKNVILSVYSVISIASIVVCVLGFVQNTMGWELGVAESIAAVIVIGFSVDYVVHLGHMYYDCKDPSRVQRTTFAAKSMGATVVAGAITTLGAGMVMWLCQITFFTKMAVLISMTIIFSFIMALGPFMCLCMLLGPQGTSGDLGVMLSKLPCWKKQ
jgi:hypothetical protein